MLPREDVAPGLDPFAERPAKWTRIRWRIYAVLVTALYLHYFFAGVSLKVNAVRSFLVLLLVDGAPPPV